MEEYLKNLKSRDAAKREWAAYVLGENKVKEALPHLIKLLRDRNPFVRASAAYALGEIGDKRAIGYLKRASTDRDFFVRLNAVRALSKFNSPQIFRWLRELIREETEPLIKIEALHFLSADKTKTTKHFLMWVAFNERNPFVRAASLRALSSYVLSDRELSRIYSLMDDVSASVRVGAYTLLKQNNYKELL